MTECILSAHEIRKLNRDLQILIATNGTLTRILNVIANDEIVVQIIKQQIHDSASKIPQLEDPAVGRVLQRDIVLKGRTSGNPFVAAESLIAVDLLPPAVTANLTETARPIGEVMAASRIESFKEEAKIWRAELPDWLAPHGYRDSPAKTVARRYRVIVGGQPAIIITEYFLRSIFHGAVREGPDDCQHPNDIETGNGDRFVPSDRIPRSLAR
ncbi:DUF98 domain-containing protein [Mycobacterium shinjukuense]|uniref:Chorismate pyruvate-lyase n=1 Tax=Mycobacterium shinjukuense TaxID=398694 RepID=A0A7I7MKY6_9MYCO|nr:chorismate pyruvate-lyase family protein [Mycobacterium shinjukuense]MCV6985982.1 DUF98 domain-containing protein [Mycobacterium shinjukuense]ORB70505.1 chorismate--pyruvate lyase [Mycobacterium shinjukuense]BBX72815.1 chorismate pyruvate-lyase [Mycobacterium shinjukuense]